MKKYSSRKFLMGLFAILLSLANLVLEANDKPVIPVEQFLGVLGVLLGYIIVEGKLDSQAMSKEK